jgi:O-antigen/teichoic acid export membrane protein
LRLKQTNVIKDMRLCSSLPASKEANVVWRAAGMTDGTNSPSDRSVGRAIRRNVVFLSIGQVLSTALGFFLTVALGRSLVPAEFGVYYSILTLSGIMGLLVDWGQSALVLREVARGRQHEPVYLGSSLLLRFLLLVPAMALAAALSFALDYPPEVTILAPAALLCGAPGIVGALFASYLRGKDRTDLDVASGLVGRAVGVLMTITALWLGGRVAAAVLVPSLGAIASLPIYWRFARGSGCRFEAPTKNTLHEIFVSGAPLVLVSTFMNMQSFIDITLLNMIADPQVVGWFGAARVILGLLIAPATIIASASFPELCRAAGSKNALVGVMTQSARPLLALGALGASGVYVFSPTAVSLIYGHGRFDPAATILQVSALFLPLFFLNYLLGYTATAVGRNLEVAMAKFFCLAISAGLSWYLIGYFQKVEGNGAIGLVVSFGLTELIIGAVFAYLLPRGVIAGAHVVSWLLRAYIVAAVAYACSFAWLPGSTLWAIIPAYVAGFLLAAMATGLVRRADFSIALEMAQSFARKVRNAG